jgi:hypothetical protein
LAEQVVPEAVAVHTVQVPQSGDVDHQQQLAALIRAVEEGGAGRVHAPCQKQSGERVAFRPDW